MQAMTASSDATQNPALHSTLRAADCTYAAFWQMPRNERVEVLKARLPVQLLDRLVQDMKVPRERLSSWLGLSKVRASLSSKSNVALSMTDGERILGMARLIGQVETVVAESGNPVGFNAAEWTGWWLGQPNRSFAQRSPGEFMDTADGRELVFGLVAQMQSGAYA